MNIALIGFAANFAATAVLLALGNVAIARATKASKEAAASAPPKQFLPSDSGARPIASGMEIA